MSSSINRNLDTFQKQHLIEKNLDTFYKHHLQTFETMTIKLKKKKGVCEIFGILLLLSIIFYNYILDTKKMCNILSLFI